MTLCHRNNCILIIELHFSVDFQLKDTFWNEKQYIEKNYIY